MNSVTPHIGLQAISRATAPAPGTTPAMQQLSEAALDDSADAGSVRVLNKISQEATKKSLADRGKDIKKTADSGRSAQLNPVEKIKDAANQLSQNKPQLKAATLIRLRSKIKPGDTKEDVLRHVLEEFPDPADADDALQFLLDTTPPDSELRAAIQDAKNDHNATHSKEIKAAHEEAAAEAESGTGISFKTWEDIKKFMANQPDILATFTMLEQHAGNFKEQKVIVAKLLHQLGEVSKTKGQGIEHGELDTNMKQIRFLQTHLGVFTFFRGRMALMQGVINNLNKMNGQEA